MPIGAGLAFFLLLLLLLAGYRWWAAPGSPPPAEPRVPRSGGTLKIVSLNLYNRPWQRASRLRSALAELREIDADVVALQEVASGWILPGDPAEYLAQGLGMPHVARAWHERNLGVFRTGLAILSRFPLRDPEYREFARHGFWDAKGALWARIATPQGELRLINLHMASTSDEAVRLSEWDELAHWATALRGATPVAITGDFNTAPGHPALRAFREATGARSAYDGRPDLLALTTWSPSYFQSCARGHRPGAELLDHAFALPPLAFASGAIIDSQRSPRPSDHCAIAAELEWPPL